MPGPLQNFCKQLIWILRPVKGGWGEDIKKESNTIKRKYFAARVQALS